MAGPHNDKQEHPDSPLNPYDERTQQRIERETERQAGDNIAGRGEFDDVPAESLEAGYELRDVNLRGLIRASVALLIFTLVAVAATTAILGARTGGFDLGITGDLSPDPEGEVPERIESRRIEGVEYNYWYLVQSRRLDTYGYLDDAGSQVPIPIDRAMELLLEEGAFPARADGAEDPIVEGRARSLRHSASEEYEAILQQLEEAMDVQHDTHADEGEDGAE